MNQWQGFNNGNWNNKVDVRDFIQKNITPYEGDENFLKSATERTTKLWKTVSDLMKKEISKAHQLCEEQLKSYEGKNVLIAMVHDVQAGHFLADKKVEEEEEKQEEG